MWENDYTDEQASLKVADIRFLKKKIREWNINKFMTWFLNAIIHFKESENRFPALFKYDKFLSLCLPEGSKAINNAWDFTSNSSKSLLILKQRISNQRENPQPLFKKSAKVFTTQVSPSRHDVSQQSPPPYYMVFG